MKRFKQTIGIFLALSLLFLSTNTLSIAKADINKVKAEAIAFKTIPKIKGIIISGNKLIFKYRNEKLSESTKAVTLYSVKVKINGKPYKMTYDKVNACYTYTLTNIKPRLYTYSFLETIKGVTRELPDPTNNIKGKSFIEYKGLEINIKALVTPKVINSNQNAVVSINLTGVNAKAVFYKDIYMDLSEVGGPKNVKLDKVLMKQTIGVKDSVSEGEKKLPITLIDSVGNKHFGSVNIYIQNKESKGELAFDFDEARIYFIMTDRFFNGDTRNDDPNHQNYDKAQPMTYHGGDFKGLTEKIDYLKELGINTIWITPIVENTDFNQILKEGAQYSYHGYWAKNFTKLDPHLGTMKDFKELIDIAHDNGIKIMVDVVLNHAGYGMKGADPSYKGVSNYPANKDREVFNGMFRSVSGTDDWTRELSGLPDFKTEEAKVRSQIITWQTAWIENAKTEKGNTIDYFRVDTVKNVDDTTFKAFKNTLTNINPDFKIIGEYYNGSISNDGDQLNNGQMDALLDFSYKNLADHFVNGKLSSIEKMLEERASKLSNTATLGQFLGSHDENGFLTRQNINGDLNKLKVAASLQITDKGIPVIYYGEELGASAFAGYPKDANRYDMPWSNLTSAGYKSVHDHYEKLLNIRKTYSLIFAKGDRHVIGGNNEEKFLAFSRSYKNQTVITALNIDDKDKQVKLKVTYAAGTKLIDSYSGRSYTVDDSQTINFIIPKISEGGTAILGQ